MFATYLRTIQIDNWELVPRVTLAFFLTNFCWEVCHSLTLYAGFEAVGAKHIPSVFGYLQLMMRVSTVDTVLLLGVLGVGALVWRRVDWFTLWDRRKLAFVVAVTVLIAIWIEYRGVFLLQLWSYNDRMPTVWGVGLSPLVQLPLTLLVSVWLVVGARNQKSVRPSSA